MLFALEGIAGFNDLGTDGEGRVYVGMLCFMLFAGESSVPGRGVANRPRGRGGRALRGIESANGLGFSPDESTIYVCGDARGEILADDLTDGGEATGRARVRALPFGRGGWACSGH